MNSGYGDDLSQVVYNSESSNLAGSVYENQIVFGITIQRELLSGDSTGLTGNQTRIHDLTPLQQIAL